MKVEILKSADDLARAAATLFVAKSCEAILETDRFTVALSGGSTPKRLYELLADPAEPFRDQIAWEKIHFFWSDERDVPPHHPESNYRMAREALLSRVPITRENVHRIEPENQVASDAAARYEALLQRVTGEALPKLDLILLGLGSDGHTASIFPGSEVLQETKRLVASPWVEKLKSYRITMTLPLLNNGATVLFLVSGGEKAQIVKEVLKGPEKYPAQFVRPRGSEALWMLDKKASADYAD